MIDLSIPMPLIHVLLDLQWSCFEVKLARLLPQVPPVFQGAQFHPLSFDLSQRKKSPFKRRADHVRLLINYHFDPF